MHNIFLETKNLILEPLEEKHITEEYASWLNDKEVTRFNSHGVFPNTLGKTADYVKNVQNSPKTIALALIDKKTKKHIGNTAIDSIDFINSHADLTIMIGNKDFWGKGYAKEALRELIKHCFNKLNLNKITAGTTSDNVNMQKILQKLNMTQEATIREAVRRDGEYFDIYRYGLLKKEFIQE